MASYRILLIGGGTGGHIYPLVAVSIELQKLAKERGADLELMAVADSNEWKNEFESLGIKFKKILTPKLRRYEGNLNLLDIFKLPITLIQSFWYLFVFMPDLVFAKGGYVSIIPSLVGRIYFVPLFIHDSDSVLKGANKFLSKFTKKSFVSFETTLVQLKKNNNIVLSGNPIRKELLNGNKNQAAAQFNFSLDKKTILFLGGSRGAKFINNLVLASLILLTQKFQIIHQIGDKNFNEVNKEVEKMKIEKNYRAFGFLNQEELKSAYALADVVVSRAGANLIFEIAALGKPAIIIPYPYAIKEHQRENAREFAKFGAIVLEEENLKPSILIDQIGHLLNPDNYSSISQRIKQFAKPDAAEIIAQEVYSYAFRQ